MSSMMPTRHATESWAVERPPTKRERKRDRTFSFSKQWENPASDLSLPLQASLHSSLSSDSEVGAYKLTAFNALAPRPTLRYEHGARRQSPQLSPPTRTDSHKKGVGDSEPISEETLKAHKRIYELADELDASGLRELMERDQRRRERKRDRDQDQAERRLARKIEQHKQEEAEAVKSGTPPPENLERGVMGRELAGLGIQPASAVLTSSKHRSTEDLDTSQRQHQEEEVTPLKPLDTFHRTDTIPPEEPLAPQSSDLPQPSRTSPPLEADEPVSPLPQGMTLAGLLRSKKSRSRSTLNSEKDNIVTPPPGKLEDDVPVRGQGGNKRPSRFSFSSLLRRSGKSVRDSGPSSFSNTSREEMQAAAIAQAQALQAQMQAQAQVPTTTKEMKDPKPHSDAETELHASSAQPRLGLQSNPQALAKLQGQDIGSSEPASPTTYLSRQSSSAVPKRTRSRFREDLPDFPLSPPDSRVQSPELEPPLPTVTEHAAAAAAAAAAGMRPSSNARYSTPTSGHRSVEATRHMSASTDAAFGAPSPDANQSISLASIDSEGSWLSGRMSGRQTSGLRDSFGRSNRRVHSHQSDSPTESTQEDLAIADDEYLSRLAPHRTSGTNYYSRRSGEGRPSSDEEDFADEGDEKWSAMGARDRPNVVEGREDPGSALRSREGTVNMESEEDDGSEYPVSPFADVQRAKSVQMGKGHARNFSAGSAKLLDITPRASVDSKAALSRERRPSSHL